MKRTFLALLFCALANISQAEESPSQFIERYVSYFNAEDIKQYQSAFVFPVVRSTGGVLEVLSDPDLPMANFENIKKTGWVKSRIDSIKVLSESSEAALVEFSFSRIDSSDIPFFQSIGHYGLVSTEDGWKIQSMFFVNPITVGTD